MNLLQLAGRCLSPELQRVVDAAMIPAGAAEARAAVIPPVIQPDIPAAPAPAPADPPAPGIPAAPMILGAFQFLQIVLG